jgi:alpha-tubulin suppressor-like RCC1 family protein
MAWCGYNFTVLNAGAARQELLYMGQKLGQIFFENEERQIRTPVPEPLFAGFDAVHVAFGDEHMVIVTACQRLFVAGKNSKGQLGRGPSFLSGSCKLRPSQPRGRVLGAACGGKHTLVVIDAKEGAPATVWGCGDNIDGQVCPARPEDKCIYCWTTIDIAGLAAGPAALASPAKPRVAAGACFSVVVIGGAVGFMGSMKFRLTAFTQPAPNLRIAVNPPWRGAAIRHVVAGYEHVIVACAVDRRLELYGWGGNDSSQLGLILDKTGRHNREYVLAPTRVPFDCPLQASDDFPSILAAFGRASMVMVGGRVWSLGSQGIIDTHPPFLPPWMRGPTEIDPHHFDRQPVSFVGLGPCHAAFVTSTDTTGAKLYMRGSQNDGVLGGDNGIPTSTRRTKSGVIGVCGALLLNTPALVPPELFGGLSLRISGLAPAHKLAFVMGTHPRLGSLQGTPSGAGARRGKNVKVYSRPCVYFDIDELVLRMIIEFADALAPPLICP